MRLSSRTPALAAEYAARSARPSTPALELKFTMLPPPLAQVRVHGLHRDQAPDDVDVQLARQVVGLELGQGHGALVRSTRG